MKMTRRQILISAAGLAGASPFSAIAQSAPAMHVLKDPACGCCDAWIDVLRHAGFHVTEEASAGAHLMRYKMETGVPREMVSCHTGEIEGYIIEGHVPVADILRLLDERPHAVGLAVPGMPYGSPGMGPENEREAYDVFLMRSGGEATVYASYDAG